MIKKLLVLFLLVFLVGCTNQKIERNERQASSSVNNYETLVNNVDLKLRVKIMDELSSKNSYYLSQDENLVYNFYSKRTIQILDDFNSGINIDSIFNSEAIVENTHYLYEGMRPLEKGNEYIIYLEFSKDLKGYIIPVYEGAIVNVDKVILKATDPDVVLSDFVTLLSIDDEVDEATISAYGAAKYRAGILELVTVVSYDLDVNGTEINYSVGDLDAKTKILEVGGMQFVIGK